MNIPASVALLFFGLSWVIGLYVGEWTDGCDRIQNVGLMWLAVAMMDRRSMVKAA
jgi:hypothetical protein